MKELSILEKLESEWNDYLTKKNPLRNVWNGKSTVHLGVERSGLEKKHYIPNEKFPWKALWKDILYKWLEFHNFKLNSDIILGKNSQFL